MKMNKCSKEELVNVRVGGRLFTIPKKNLHRLGANINMPHGVFYAQPLFNNVTKKRSDKKFSIE
jgi:hypothetical protein